jgi:mRNA-degrading endonuclease RelE of RelBE toxin-antitoxin system
MSHAAYRLRLHKTAEKELQDMPKPARDDLTDLLRDLQATESPTTHQKIKHLQGVGDLFRLRSGEYRAVCRLDKPHLLVLTVGHRSHVYDGINQLKQA